MSGPSTTFITSNVANALLGSVTGGFAVAQCCTYLALTQNELKYRILIGALICLDIVVIIGYLVDCTLKFGRDYGDVSAQRRTDAPIFVAFFSHGLIMWLILGSYTHRSWIMLEKKLWVLLLLVPTVIAAGAGVMWLAIYQLKTGDLTVVRANLGETIALPFVLPAIADVVVSATMFLALWRTKKLGVSSMSGKVVRRIIKICLETNLLTTALQLLAMTLYLATRELHFFLVASLPHVYVATFMLWLVSRLGTRQIIANSSGGAGDGTSGNKKSSGALAFQPSGIHVSHVRSMQIDGSSNSELELEDLEMDRKDRVIRFEHNQAV